MSGLTSNIIKEISMRGKKTYSPFFTYVAPVSGFFLEKPAFIASKKEFKTAVLRNKAKRRARNAFCSIFLGKKGIFGLFLLKKDILKEKIPLISESFKRIVKTD